MSRTASYLLTFLLLTACDDPVAPNMPPRAMGIIPEQMLEPGASATVDVADYFDDPDEGDLLTYTAETTNPSLLTATMSGYTLTLTGIAAGLPSVIVTATDPGGLYATQSALVVVRPANRPPEAVGTIPPLSVPEDVTFETDAVWYFTDPDGDSLVYTAASADPEVARAEVSGTILMITATGSGNTEVTLTATDPEGLAADHRIRVVAGSGPSRFRDDFDAPPLSAWELADADAQFADGLLRLANAAPDLPGAARLGLNLRLTDWKTSVRLGRGHGDGLVRLVFQTADENVPAIAAEFGPGVEWQGEDTNFRFMVLAFREEQEPIWSTFTAGRSEALNDSVGALTSLSVSLEEMRLRFTVGADTLLFIDLGELGAPPEAGVLTGLQLWSVPLGEVAGRTALFDWIELSGRDPEMAHAMPQGRNLHRGAAPLPQSAVRNRPDWVESPASPSVARPVLGTNPVPDRTRWVRRTVRLER